MSKEQLSDFYEDPFADIPEAEPREPKPLSFHMQGMGIDGPVRLFKCFVPETNGDGQDAAFYFAMNDHNGEGVISMADPADGFTLAHHFYRAVVDENIESELFEPEPEDERDEHGNNRATTWDDDDDEELDVVRMIAILEELKLIQRHESEHNG